MAKREPDRRRKMLFAVGAVCAVFGVEARAQFCPGQSPWVFTDIPANDAFCGFVTWMAQHDITLGCQTIDANNRLYCPNDFVTRKQMAAFMARLGRDNAFVDGGNAFGATAVLGTTDDQALAIVVNGLRMARFDQAGNVILGHPSSTPSGVNGTIGGGYQSLVGSVAATIGGRG